MSGMSRRACHLDAPSSIAWQEAPTDRRGLLTIVVTWASLVGGLSLVGLLVVEMWDDSRFGVSDADVNRWFERRRTDTWTSWADAGSALSDTLNVVIVVAICLPIFLLWFRRWHEFAALAVGLVVEVTAFLAASSIVGRPRPPVEQLDGAPTNSFPSGHIAAATVLYGSFALFTWMRNNRRLVRTVAVSLSVAAVAAVVFSRLYLGMHYVTDAVGGLILGLGILIVMHRCILRDPQARRADPDHPRTGARERGHDDQLDIHEGASA